MKNHKKIKFFQSVILIAISLCFFVSGVFSLSVRRQVDVSGNISFKASAVYFDYVVFKSLPYNQNPSYTHLESGSVNQTTGQTIASINLGTANLDDTNNKFAYKISIKSNENMKDIAFTYTIPQGMPEVFQVRLNGDVVENGQQQTEEYLMPGQETEIEFAFIVDSKRADPVAFAEQIGTSLSFYPKPN